ncbi:NitT/TauT family transport system substrate-binding protein [Arboricoccus pini]|uniref:NitT/TauT family transport system substrate-binding protein n=1 Tax=Arboricoccus pini TaxID=1963835 RepID=A0A212RKT2_9PROT|nr:ABC transporter substrate-binding protein [Arboricoccus pini]SNB73069.1 NitT/TauT family transport system substrate-binding protein [Arboricoccus pini]
MCQFCDRGFPNPSHMRLGRRSFLKTTAAGALTIGLPFVPSAQAAEDTVFKGTHGTGFCNSAFFMTHARQLAKQEGVTLQFVNTPTNADQVTFFATGQVDVSVLPYTSFLALYDGGAPVRIVGGGGIQGCSVVAQPGLDTPAKLKGKTLGTFQLDTLEVLPYDWLKKNGLSFSDINVRYLGSTPEQVEAFKAGAIDIAGVIEPYASALLQDVKGAVLLSDGIDVYGPEYSDCVLAARTEVIEKNPDGIKALIKGMLQGQYLFESEREETLKQLVGPYYKLSLENARIGASKQPPKVDQRAQEDFILTRVESVMEMGYLKKKPGKDAIDWSLLEAAIKESSEVYGKLKYKSA